MRLPGDVLTLVYVLGARGGIDEAKALLASFGDVMLESQIRRKIIQQVGTSGVAPRTCFAAWLCTCTAGGPKAWPALMNDAPLHCHPPRVPGSPPCCAPAQLDKPAVPDMMSSYTHLPTYLRRWTSSPTP